MMKVKITDDFGVVTFKEVDQIVYQDGIVDYGTDKKSLEEVGIYGAALDDYYKVYEVCEKHGHMDADDCDCDRESRCIISIQDVKLGCFLFRQMILFVMYG